MIYFRLNRQIRQMCLWQISKGKLSKDFFFEGFEERHDEDDDDEGKGGEGLDDAHINLMWFGGLRLEIGI